MRALDLKLTRDLWRLRGQVIAVAMVVASGVGVLVMSLTALHSLEETARAYYERYRFAHVFANVERAHRGLHAPGLTHLMLSGEECRIINLHRNLDRVTGVDSGVGAAFGERG